MSESLLPVVVLVVGWVYFSPMFHEYCHAVAVRRLGGTVTHMGPTRGLFRLSGWRCDYIPPKNLGAMRWKSRVIALAPVLVGLAIPSVFIGAAIMLPAQTEVVIEYLTTSLSTDWFWVAGALWLNFMLGISADDIMGGLLPRSR
jgi:hypothetical protein